MALSYSAAARPASQNQINATNESQPEAGPSSRPGSPAPINLDGTGGPSTRHLILDAGPLLSLTPLRHLAQHLHTTPQVVAELRDPRAREHLQNLSLQGVDVKVEAPSQEAFVRVIEFAKKTGDYAVLSQTDLGVVALTLQYELAENGETNVRNQPGERKAVEKAATDPTSTTTSDAPRDINREQGSTTAEPSASGDDAEEGDLTTTVGESSDGVENEVNPSSPVPPQDDDDAEGEWITPSNVNKHRSHDLGLMPDAGGSSQTLTVACMTGDYAVQNVLLGLGLGLVGEGGKKITKVKSWVLRCHACFKLCWDPSKKFCPSCGNPTLMRTTVTTSAKTGKQQIHLKKNFQYNLRGTKFSIPDAKAGRAKGQQKGGTGLILREDQAEWQDALKVQAREKVKEEKRLAKGTLEGWNDPDWMPELLTVGNSGKGRTGPGGMPSIGHGRKNPNQARRKR